MFQAPIPASAASTAAQQQQEQQSSYDDDDSNHHDGPVADENQENWVEGAEHGVDDLDGGGGVAYWDAHGQQHLQHHHAGYAGGGYGQYEAGAYHGDGYDYHQVHAVLLLQLRTRTAVCCVCDEDVSGLVDIVHNVNQGTGYWYTHRYIYHEQLAIAMQQQ